MFPTLPEAMPEQPLKGQSTLMRMFSRLRSLPGLIAAAGLTVLVVALLAGTAPTWFGYQSFTVLGGSMEPAMSLGDLAVVAPMRAEQLQTGDIITYRQVAQADLAVTHRIIAIDVDQDGQKSFVTKGDANNTTDQVAVDSGTVLGKVVYVVPYIGYVVDFSRSTQGKVLLIGIPGAILLTMDLWPALRRRRNPEASTPGSENASDLIAQARAALGSGDRAAALAFCDRAIAADPHYEDAWLMKADCLTDAAEAATLLQTAMVVNPRSERIRQAAAGGNSEGRAAAN